MAEYIDREVAKRELLEWATIIQKPRHLLSEAAMCVLDNIPAADVAPVVLCKDCKHYEMGVCLKIYSDGNVSKNAWQERQPDDFCSYGERKDGDE